MVSFVSDANISLYFQSVNRRKDGSLIGVQNTTHEIFKEFADEQRSSKDSSAWVYRLSYRSIYRPGISWKSRGSIKFSRSASCQ
jgi:hypothetical protein